MDYSEAGRVLRESFSDAENAQLERNPPDVPSRIAGACDVLFRSPTQAYREVLLGCVRARLLNGAIDVRRPYVKQGPGAFSGRSLDEKVVNPFLQEKRIPCSRGPYLSVFRRSVRFDESARDGLRDKDGYDALLAVLGYVETRSPNEPDLRSLLVYVLYAFAELRDRANVSLADLHRTSLEQLDLLASGLLATPSGGRLPVMLVVATLEAIRARFELDWKIECQGINVADSASGAGGDIVVRSRGTILFAAEVTERQVDPPRVVATFNAKILPAAIEDYLFFSPFGSVGDEACRQARQYFAQGHEINFLEIRQWIRFVLATIGMRGRNTFRRKLRELIGAREVPASLKLAWNEQVSRVPTAL